MSSKILIQFGKRIREERTKRGISQERLGKLAKVHRTYVGMIERGEMERVNHLSTNRHPYERSCYRNAPRNPCLN